MNKRINIRSRQVKDLSTRMVIDAQEYFVETELLSGPSPSISSRIFKGGEIISTRKYTLGHGVEGMNSWRLSDLMSSKHRLTLETLKREAGKVDSRQDESVHQDEISYANIINEKVSVIRPTFGQPVNLSVAAASDNSRKRPGKPSDYIRAANTLLSRKDYPGAMKLFADGLSHFPEDPFILSSYGFLAAKVENDYDKGIELCTRAIEFIGRRVPSDLEFLYPSLFINLGRVHMAAGNKKSAVETYRKVLNHHSENPHIRSALKRLGVRRKPLFPFLKRSNMFNKYSGMVLYRLTGTSTVACF